MRRTVSAAVLGLALGGCSVVVDVGGFHEWDAQVGQPDGGPDAFVPAPDAFMEDAFVPPVDGGPCDGDCDDDEICCDDTCVELDSLDHCGACDNACPEPTNAEATCDGVGCSFVCDTGFDDCNTDAADGCEVEVNTATDCGACGVVCAPTELCDIGPGDTLSCVDGCSGGTVPCGTSCVDIETSMSHCGACDVPCTAPAGGTAACVLGGCERICDDGFQDCNGDLDDPAGDGCEVDLQNDADHCGACGDRCFADGATSVCADGLCAISSCTGPRGDCDVDYDTGCETPLDTRMNCGACGRACALDQVCTGGSCQPCVPVVERRSSGPPPPAGMTRTCFAGPDNFMSVDCPVIQCAELTTWAFSYTDNRGSFGIVTYDPTNTIVRQAERSGARYLWNITLDPAAEIATFHGQGGGTVTRPWSDVRLP